jgi:hypothetical protein
LNKYKHSVLLNKKANNLYLPKSISSYKEYYKLYAAQTINRKYLWKYVGKVKKSDNYLKYSNLEKNKKYYIFISYENQAKSLKVELVFGEKSCVDTLSIMLVTPVISGVMPLAAPVGYYINRDYTGLSLWAVNSSPYFYITYRGVTNPIYKLRDDNENISRKNKADFYFAYYQMLFGGISLFADATSKYALKNSETYSGLNSFMGNSYTAVYLSFISGGAGHFYRGSRAWGYFYYHLSNSLLYSTIYCFNSDETYNSSTGSYEEESVDKKRAFTLLGIYSALKIVEIIHVLLTDENISVGTEYVSQYYFAPTFYSTNDNKNNYGVMCTFTF